MILTSLPWFRCNGFNLCWGSCQLQQSHQRDHPNESEKSEQPEQSDEWPWSDSNLTHRSSLALFVEPWHDLMTWYTNEANYKASCPTLVKLHGACVGCLRHAKHGAERARNLLFWSILSSWVAKCFGEDYDLSVDDTTLPAHTLVRLVCPDECQILAPRWWLLYELTIEFVGYCGHLPYIYILYIYIYISYTYIYILYRVCVNMMKRCKKVRIGIRKSALLCSSWRVAVPGTSDSRTFQ
jgi:hypothetical protein